MEEKPTYTLQELFDNLPIHLKTLGERAGVNEVTVARIRDGKPARRSTINSLLREMAKPDIYDRPLSMANVTGIILRKETRSEESGNTSGDAPLVA